MVMLPTSPSGLRCARSLALLWTGVLCGLASAQDARIDAMRVRLRTTDDAHFSFEWREYYCPFEMDPWDRSHWTAPKWLKAPATDPVFAFDFWLHAPHFRIDKTDLRGELAFASHNWIDGVHTVKSGSEGLRWGVGVDRLRWTSTEPYPILTVFELALFDLESSILELFDHGQLRAVEGDGALTELEGTVRESPETNPWSVRIMLDSAKGMLPVEASAVLTLPRSSVEWSMRVLEIRPFRGTFVASRSVFVLKNTGTPSPRYMIGEYRLTDAAVPKIDPAILKIPFPESNVLIVDEVNLFARQIDKSGTVTEEKHWTAEERAAQIEGLQSAFQSRQQAQTELQGRKAWLRNFAMAGAVAALAAGWVWRRRHYGDRPARRRGLP